MSLYKFENPDVIQGTAVSGGADILVPTNASHVNVVKDYQWTIQPESARKDVPYIFLIERKLTNDVMVQQLLYNIVATAELGFQTGTEIQKKGEEKLNEAKEKFKLSDEDINKIKSQAEKSTPNPYAGLYDLEDTGWSYILPFFDNKNHNIGGNWTKPAESGNFIDEIGGAVTSALGDVSASVNKIMSAMGAATGTTSVARPGTYIEQAKQYAFEAQGPSYSVEFNLYNTGTVTDVIDNWELCFALMYNLLPNRRTKTVFDPPPLYEVAIPGVRTSPVSFIKGMRVEFLGATRIMDLDVQGVNNTPSKLRTIVPDAYSIKIDIEDVLPESKNFMQSILNGKDRVKVSTRKETTSRSYENELISKANEITHISLNQNQKSSNQQGDSKFSPQSFANEVIGEPFKKATGVVQKTVKNISNGVRGLF
jgi:NACalpha-BTF3-like transcription factor